MEAKNSGNIYKIELKFRLGFAYAELLDFSDVSDFDGKLVQVYKLIDKTKISNTSIRDIVSSGIMFGPVPINKYPNLKGKGAWMLYGKNDNYSHTAPWFKDLRGLLNIDDDWANLKPWFKVNRFSTNPTQIVCDYEELRHFETLILNHPQMVIDKITMMLIIANGGNVGDYYNLKLIGSRNIYSQVINTYYPKNETKRLLKIL